MNQSILESIDDLTVIRDQGELSGDHEEHSSSNNALPRIAAIFPPQRESEEEEISDEFPGHESQECLLTLLAPRQDLLHDWDFLSDEMKDSVKSFEKAKFDWKGKFFAISSYLIIFRSESIGYLHRAAQLLRIIV